MAGDALLNLVLISYNDMPLIQKCLDSVKDYVDQIIMVDGIFADFPLRSGDKPISTDGTIECLINLATEAEKIIVSAPGFSEVEKRNKYLLGEPGDWHLHLDADEWVENPETLAQLPETDIGLCEIRWTNRFSRCPRLFRHIDGLHYDGLHHRLVDKDGNLYAEIRETGPGYTSEKHPLRIQHDIAARPEHRKAQKTTYYRRLTKQEHEIKEQIRYGCYTPRPYQEPD
jgi:glycosyltransferase involved in cell wall biosynthesis